MFKFSLRKDSDNAKKFQNIQKGNYRRSNLKTKLILLVLGNQRTYLDLEALTVEMFNNDPVIRAKSDLHPFTTDSWTEEVLTKLNFKAKLVFKYKPEVKFLTGSSIFGL